MSVRRGVLPLHIFKLAALGIGSAVLATCNLPVNPPIPAVPLSPAAIDNSLAPLPALTPLPTLTPAPTLPPPTPTPFLCPRLLTPENGARLPAMGRVTFTWQPVPDAAVYWLEITLPSGQTVTFDRGDHRDLYMEAFKMSGVYYWRVSAMGHGGGLLCTSDPFTFEKE